MAAPLDALMMECASIARTMHEVTVLPSRRERHRHTLRRGLTCPAGT